MLYVANTLQLRTLVHDGAKAGFNRAFPTVEAAEQFGDELDPQGKHIIEVLMIHEHINGVLVDPHYRVRVMAKLKNHDDPYEFVTDFNISLVELLERVRVMHT